MLIMLTQTLVQEDVIVSGTIVCAILQERMIELEELIKKDESPLEYWIEWAACKDVYYQVRHFRDINLTHLANLLNSIVYRINHPLRKYKEPSDPVCLKTVNEGYPKVMEMIRERLTNQTQGGSPCGEKN